MYCPDIFLDGMEEITEYLSHDILVRAEVWIRPFPNTEQEYQPLKHHVIFFIMLSYRLFVCPPGRIYFNFVGWD
jgi:hypothetical protein